MFNNLRVLAKIASELRRIANAMEYFAIADARVNKRMYHTGAKRFGRDESELLHTDDSFILSKQEEQMARFIQGGAQLAGEDEDM